MENDFLTRLKQDTQYLHTKVEQTPIARAIMHPNADLATYIAYLNKSFAIHHATEQVVFPAVSSVITDIAERTKLTSINKDLNALQKLLPDATENPFAALKGYQSTVNFNLGMLYVSEGSTLGGRYILKNLFNALGPDIPAHFLQVYGDVAGTMWKRFMDELNAYQVNKSESDREEIIAGAAYAFKWVQSCVFDQSVAA